MKIIALHGASSQNVRTLFLHLYSRSHFVFISHKFHLSLKPDLSFYYYIHDPPGALGMKSKKVKPYLENRWGRKHHARARATLQYLNPRVTGALTIKQSPYRRLHPRRERT